MEWNEGLEFAICVHSNFLTTSSKLVNITEKYILDFSPKWIFCSWVQSYDYSEYKCLNFYVMSIYVKMKLCFFKFEWWLLLQCNETNKIFILQIIFTINQLAVSGLKVNRLDMYGEVSSFVVLICLWHIA